METINIAEFKEFLAHVDKVSVLLYDDCTEIAVLLEDIESWLEMYEELQALPCCGNCKRGKSETVSGDIFCTYWHGMSQVSGHCFRWEEEE